MADVTTVAPTATVGANWSWTPTIIDPVTNLPPVPDLSTYSAADFEVRLTPGGPIILQATVANGGITLGALGTGQLTISFLGSAITAPGAYTHELKVTDANGVVSKPFGGQFNIQPTFTS